MKQLRLAVLFLLSASFCSASGFAQNPKTGADRKTEEIVIRKKTGKAEKMTIVVDGDNVTINGKPVDEFKTADVTVLRRTKPGAPMPPTPPMPPLGGDFNFETPANQALLGVMTEKTDEGVKVKEVNKETAAEKAGLKKDDIITKVGSDAVNSPQDLVETIGKHKPNDKVTITYKREGKETTTTATLGENKQKNYTFDRRFFDLHMPEGAAPFMQNFDLHMSRKPRIGLEIQDVAEGDGVKVNDVDADSPAAKAGLKEGDIITEINGSKIEGVDEAREEIRSVDDGTTVKITYKRDGKTQTGDLLVPKKIKTADL